jgi:hypothetical protein
MIGRFKRHAISAIVIAAAVLAVGAEGDSAPRCYIVGRFQLMGTSVFDGATGLTWYQTVSSQQLTLSDAATYCSSQPGGFRLPTVKELLSIVDYTRLPNSTAATINPVAFPNIPRDVVWTSSTLGNLPGALLVVFFGDGETLTYPSPAGPAYVLCVR